jgi:flagellar FliL protein
LKLLVIGLVVLLAAGAGGAWWLLRGTPAKAEAREISPDKRGLVSFETFLVNLADAGGTRFLKLNVSVVVESPETAKRIGETPVLLAQLRSTILELLTQQQASVLITAEGKEELKTHIQERAAAVLKEQKVFDVLFAEFVVQF